MGRFAFSGDGIHADTELRLRTGTNSSRSCTSPASPSSPADHHHQPLTIVYGSRVSVCHVTDVQARAIIAAAQGGTMDEREAAAGALQVPQQNEQNIAQEQRAGVHLPLALAMPQLNPGLSMRMSLQRFLQKRKTRPLLSNGALTSTTPYARPHDRRRPRHRQLQRHVSSFLL